MKRYLVIFCPSSHDKFIKSKIRSNAINLNIVQNNVFIIKRVVSGHYSHISQFAYKCIVWTIILNEDEEGRYICIYLVKTKIAFFLSCRVQSNVFLESK